MSYDNLKEKIIKLKKEELEYIDSITTLSSNKALSEYEKFEVYRNIKNYQNIFNKLLRKLYIELKKENRDNNLEDVIIEFDIDRNFLSFLNVSNDHYKKYQLLESLGIDLEDFKYKLTVYDIIHPDNRKVDINIIRNNQKLIDSPIYIFDCSYEDAPIGPAWGQPDDYITNIYVNPFDGFSPRKKVPNSKKEKFEKDKIIFEAKSNVHPSEIRRILNEELLNSDNKTLADCISKTRERIDKLDYLRSPEYKEKILLERINELYKQVKGNYISTETLYKGDFISLLKESYKLPNNKTVKKEKIVKNKGKDSVIIISITEDDNYIITFQNRMKDKIIAEFPAGYIEDNEDVLNAAKRELQEETGYTTDNLTIIDEAFSAPSVDYAKTYIVLAKDCIKTTEADNNGTELVNYGLFSKEELDYLIDNNIMNGAMNKLAYYKLNNINDKVYKKK